MMNRRSLLSWMFAPAAGAVSIDCSKPRRKSKFDPKDKYRLAVFYVSNCMLRDNHLARRKLSLDDLNLEANYSVMEKELSLPDNCEIDAISTHFKFENDMTTFRVRSPIFKNLVESCTIPDITPMWIKPKYSTEIFYGWSGREALDRGSFWLAEDKTFHDCITLCTYKPELAAMWM